MPNNDLNGLGEFLTGLGDKIDENAVKVGTQVAIRAGTAVVLETPVDTGRARGNWIGTLNSPTSEVVEAASRGGLIAVAKLKRVAKSMGKGDVFFLTNNLPYINRLNDGYSAQAPAGFVEKAVAQASNEVAKVDLFK